MPRALLMRTVAKEEGDPYIKAGRTGMAGGGWMGEEDPQAWEQEIMEAQIDPEFDPPWAGGARSEPRQWDAPERWIPTERTTSGGSHVARAGITEPDVVQVSKQTGLMGALGAERLCDPAAMAWCKSSAMNFRSGHTGLDWARCGTYEGNFCHFAYKRIHEPNHEPAQVKAALARYLTGFATGARGGKITEGEAIHIWQKILGYTGEPWDSLPGAPAPAPAEAGRRAITDPKITPAPYRSIESLPTGKAFFSQQLIGPIKVWHVAIAGAAIAVWMYVKG